MANLGSLIAAVALGVFTGLSLYALFLALHPQGGGFASLTVQPRLAAPTAAVIPVTAAAKAILTHPSPVVPSIPPPAPRAVLAHQDGRELSNALSPAVACRKMMKRYEVVPGSSWGKLTGPLQERWTTLRCDQMVRPSAPAASTPEEVPAAADEEVQQQQPMPVNMEGIPPISAEVTAWCHAMRRKYKVLPMKSWGALPKALIEEWQQDKKCDLVYTLHRMASRPLPNCTAEVAQEAAPLIAVLAASTTRKVLRPTIGRLALFTYLLPSLMRSLDCGFRYVYVLGFDEGDEFYDTPEGARAVEQWFGDHVALPLRRRGISLSLHMVKVKNTVSKPGPVFLAMGRAAYALGAAYFLRVNDDTELLDPWAKTFTRIVSSLGAPYGVVGPWCNEGNEKILTHDFTHRAHMDIFEGNYYPPALTDWWMDDWVSFVYGQTRTFRVPAVRVIHHTGAHGQRYTVDRSHERLLGDLVKSGHEAIRRYMLKQGVDEEVLRRFDKDRTGVGFPLRDSGGPPASPGRARKPPRVL